MRVTPKPTQLTGAAFLAEGEARLLADAPRVGKTGAAILAADYVWAKRILVVTTASGRGVWARAFDDWSVFPRKIGVQRTGCTAYDDDVCIVSWAGITEPKTRAALLQRRWDVGIFDESHYAKNFSARRTQAAYGVLESDGLFLLDRTALATRCDRVWPMSGTPIPNAPNDLYPMLRALAPERLLAQDDMPDVTKLSDFVHRYCVTRPMRISPWRTITIVVGGRNEAELKRRLDGFVLRRTQADVGIQQPVYETLPLYVGDRARQELEGQLDKRAILRAAEANDTRSLDMHLGPLRRLTGAIKAPLVVEAVKDELDCGTEKVVVMHWHTEVGDTLTRGLAMHGVARIDGSTPARDRDREVLRFQNDPATRVFVGQIQAAGEVIDLSVAPLLIFAEASFTPKDMHQASLRITNYGQRNLPIVRVATLAQSIDDAVQAILMRKWSSIREVVTS